MLRRPIFGNTRVFGRAEDSPFKITLDARPIRVALHEAEVKWLSTMLTRLQDTIRTRDYIALIFYGPERNTDTIDDMLYHFRAGIMTLTGAWEALAGLLARIYRIRARQITFRVDAFRKELVRASNQLRVLEEPAFRARLNLLWRPRNVMSHREGMGQMMYSPALGPSSEQMLFRVPGRNCLLQNVADLGDKPEDWGFSVSAGMSAEKHIAI